MICESFDQILNNAKIPVYANAPLLQPASSDKSEPVTGQWPLLIFSHGLGGSRTAYRFVVLISTTHSLIPNGLLVICVRALPRAEKLSLL